MPVPAPVMSISSLESTLWYLSLPVLVYVAWRFVLLNVRQYERLNPPAAPPAEATASPTPTTTPAATGPGGA